MAHPYQHHREHHVERERVHHITGGHEGHRDYEHVYHRARGGKVEHDDASEDKALVKGLVKSSALKHSGHKAKHRSDKVHRAKGGRVKKNKATVVNVNVAPQQPQAAHPPMIAPPPPAAGAPPPPRPPMAPPPGGPPGGMPPPGMMGPRAMGGRTYKKGGRVGIGYPTGPAEAPRDGSHPGPAIPKNMAKRATGGPVEPHLKQGVGMGPTGKGMPKGKPVKLGKDAIYAPAKDAMGPTSNTGTGGAVARLELSHRARKYYHKTPPARHTP